jgi:hypothetical protein
MTKDDCRQRVRPMCCSGRCRAHATPGPARPAALGSLSDHPLLKADPRRFFEPALAMRLGELSHRGRRRDEQHCVTGQDRLAPDRHWRLAPAKSVGFHLIIMPPAAGLLPEFEGAGMSRSDPFDLQNAGRWPQKMQSLSKHGRFAYLENLGLSGPTSRRGSMPTGRFRRHQRGPHRLAEPALPNAAGSSRSHANGAPPPSDRRRSRRSSGTGTDGVGEYGVRVASLRRGPKPAAVDNYASCCSG